MGRKAKALKLKQKDREELKEFLSVGKRSARAIKRAMMLKYLDEGKHSSEIIDLLDTSLPTIYKVKNRYHEEGLEAALSERPRCGQPRKIGRREEAYITSIACSKPPKGRKRWTIESITDTVIELGYIEKVSRESVRKVLKKANSNPG